MRAAVAVTLLVVAVAAAGCGGTSHVRRDAVNLYFDRVDAAQLPVRNASASIAQAISHFSVQHNSSSEVRALTRAHSLFSQVEARLMAMHPPADAMRIHAQLVHYYAVQFDVTGELVQMTQFVPRFAKAIQPLKSTHDRLTAELKLAKGWQPVATAFARYRGGLASIVAQLELLVAPATFLPAFTAQKAGLSRSVQLCLAIESALAHHNATATTAGIRSLANVGAENAAAKVRGEQIAAAKAYNARLAQVGILEGRIAKERDRLVAELG